MSRHVIEKDLNGAMLSQSLMSEVRGEIITTKASQVDIHLLRVASVGHGFPEIIVDYGGEMLSTFHRAIRLLMENQIRPPSVLFDSGVFDSRHFERGVEKGLEMAADLAMENGTAERNPVVQQVARGIASAIRRLRYRPNPSALYGNPDAMPKSPPMSYVSERLLNEMLSASSKPRVPDFSKQIVDQLKAEVGLQTQVHPAAVASVVLTGEGGWECTQHHFDPDTEKPYRNALDSDRCEVCGLARLK